MLNRWTSVMLFGAVWGLSPAVNAADEPLSYTANNSCFCNLSATSSLHERIVSTPVGGQTVMQVCERIGAGPELKKSAGRYNFPVFDDLQCGHGPGLTGYRGLLSDLGPSIDKAPKWDLAGVYQQPNKTNTLTNAKKSTWVDPNKVNELAPGDETSATVTATAASPARRFKPRYIKVPNTASEFLSEKTAVGTGATIKKPVVASKRKPVRTREYTEDQENMASLPLAETLPLTDEVPETVSTVEQDLTISVEESVNTTEEVAVVSKPIKEADVISENVNSASNSPDKTISVSNAFRMPPSVRASSREFEYLSVIPVSYDFGGAGVRFTASSAPTEKLRLILRAALVRTYQEGIVGASYIYTPPIANRLTFALTGGVEYGRFTLEDENIETTVSDTGVFAQLTSRFVVNNRFELQSGVGVSSFFDGDPHAFGAAFYHITKKLDLTGEFEIGDNDSLGLGIRYYY